MVSPFCLIWGKLVKIRLAVTGRAYHTAEHLPEELEIPDGGSLDDMLCTFAEQYGTDAGLPGSCLVAVSGRHVGTVASHQNLVLRDGDEVALIAPVAGG